MYFYFLDTVQYNAIQYNEMIYVLHFFPDWYFYYVSYTYVNLSNYTYK